MKKSLNIVLSERQREIYDSLTPHQQGQFHEVESYLTRWETGRELTRVLKDCKALTDGP